MDARPSLAWLGRMDPMAGAGAGAGAGAPPVREPIPEAGTAGDAEAATLAARLLVLDGAALGGVRVRARAGPAREAWLEEIRRSIPGEVPWRRLPPHVDDERLLGGLDVAGTVAAGRPVHQAGLLEQARGGWLVASMADRLEPRVAARVAAALDREGGRAPGAFAVIALDETAEEEGAAPGPDGGLVEVLAQRLALDIRLSPSAPGGRHALWAASASTARLFDPVEHEAARARLGRIAAREEWVEALCEAADALGVVSMRTVGLAWRAACGVAALAGRESVEAGDLAWATRLVLGPRAVRWPAAEDAQPSPELRSLPEPAPPQATEPAPPASTGAEEPAPPPRGEDAPGDSEPSEPPREPSTEEGTLADKLVQAAAVALPAGLLAALAAGLQGASASSGRSGERWRGEARHGPVVGSRRGDLRGGARLDLLRTLRTAAPWQRLRRELARRAAGESAPAGVEADEGRILLARDDLHRVVRQARSQTTTVFLIDASGSQALHRMAEAKGAVELLLARCYVRRDRVAVVAFRGQDADLLVPPTRSLVRARRCLAGLAGGGGTPLARGLDAARRVAEAVRRDGGTPSLVLLTDGGANIDRAGRPGRPQAQADALASARALAAVGATAVVIDTAARPREEARAVAACLGARYVTLPHGGAADLARAAGAEPPVRRAPR